VLTAAEHSATIALHLWKDAAITGMVVDEADEPTVGVQVRALRRTWLSGRALLQPQRIGTNRRPRDLSHQRAAAWRIHRRHRADARDDACVGPPQGLDPR
jgi:hypothetical protein